MPPNKIVQCGYMSGDTYSAAALLKLDRDIKILLVKDTKGSGAYADKSGQILKLYKETGVQTQVEQIDVSGTAIGIKDLWDAVKDKYAKGVRVPPKDLRPGGSETPLEKHLRQFCWSHKPLGQWPRSITAVTGLLANKWEADPDGTQQAIAQAWKIGELPEELESAMGGYMFDKCAKLNGTTRNNVLVLWSRQSGKKGGAHLELDSSYDGIRQLAWHFAETDPRAAVLLAGDERNGKLADLAKRSAHIVDISEMWNDPVWKTHFGQATFLAQFAFFKFIAAHRTVIHLGMRSGILEAMALLGMETFYLEPISLQGTSGKRMVAFQNKGITYTRIQFNTAPGLTARLVDKKPFLSQEVVEDKVSTKAAIHMSRPKFKSYFSTDNKAARAFAKMDLLQQPVNYAGTNMDDLRGFRTPDFDKITRLVGGAMV